ncbi:MAG: tetratricopeptide repeat protein [bacterium]
MTRNLIPTFILENLKNSNKSGSFFGYVISGDIVNFTPAVENLMKEGKGGAEYMGRMLNSTFGKVTDIVYSQKGFITNFAGDAFTAIFFNENSADDVLKIAQTLINVFSDYKDSKKIKLHIRLGISSGVIDWGIVGRENEKSGYYFKGEGINSAVRIQQNGECDTIQFDKRFRSQLSKDVKVKESNSFFYIDPIKTDKFICEKIHRTRNENNRFFPEILSGLASDGEFRQVIPIFVRFPFDTGKTDIEKIAENLIENARKFEAYLNKIDFGDKGGIALVIFGAPYAHEDMIDRAVQFSLAVKEELKEYTISVGIDYGVSYAGFIGSSFWHEYTVIGDIVNTSARLATLTDDRISVSSRIKEESRDFAFKKVDSIKLKGKTESVDVFSVSKSKERFKGDFISPFVGREKETSDISKFIAKCMKNSSHCMINIIGESGTGKTRLAFESVNMLNMKYFYSNSDPIIKESMFPFKVFLSSMMLFNLFDTDSVKREMIEKFCEKNFTENCARFSAFLKYFFIQEEDSSLKNLSGKEKLEGIFFVIKEVLIINGRQKRITYIFDDAMWLDDESAEFIKFLIREKELSSSIFMFLFREESRATKKLESAEAEKFTVKLVNFQENGAKDFVEQFFGKSVSTPLVSLLWKKSEGNPLFLEQLSLHLVDNNMITSDGEFLILKSDDYEIPSNIDRLIVSRLDSLSAITRDGIQKASVIGKEFEVVLLKNLLNSKKLQIVLNEGEKNKIISLLSNQTAFFRHILLHEIAYKMQFENTLVRLHGRIAQLYEKLFAENLLPYYETLYHHYRKSKNKKKTLYYLKKTIEKDIKGYSNENALSLMDELLELNISQSDRKEYSLKKGEILRHIGRYEQALKLYKSMLKERGNRKYEGEIRKGTGEALWAMGKYEDALKEYDKALLLHSKTKNERGTAEILEKKGMVFYNRGDYKQATSEFKSALHYSKKNKKMTSSILSNLGLVLYRQGEYDKAMTFYTRSLKNARSTENLNDQALFLLRIGLIHFEKQDYKKALECYFKSLEINSRIGNRRNEGVTLGNIGTVYNDMGEGEKALEYLHRAIKIDREINNLDNESIVLGNLANIYAVRGDYMMSLTYYMEALEVDKKIGSKWSEAIDLGNIGQMYKLQKNYAMSDKHFKLCIGIIREMNARYPLSHFLLQRAQLQHDMKNFSLSMKLADEALEIAKELKKEKMIKNAEDLIKVLKKKIGKNK